MGTVHALPNGAANAPLRSFLMRASDAPPRVVDETLVAIGGAPSTAEAVELCRKGLQVSRTLATAIVREVERTGAGRASVYGRCHCCKEPINSRERVGMVTEGRPDGTRAVKLTYCARCCAIHGIR